MTASIPNATASSISHEADVSAAEIPPAADQGLVRVVVFNDHPVFRSSLSWKVGEQSGVELVADAASLSETLQVARDGAEGPVDVVVADLRIGDGNAEGIDSVKTLVSRLDGIPVIVYSDQYSRSFATRIFEAGAAAMLQKSSSAEQLVAAIHDAAGTQRNDGEENAA